MDNNVLVHHGIKGMRWGIRRTEKQLARARGENPDKKKTTSTPAKASSPATKSASSSSPSSSSTSAKGSSKKATDNDEAEQISTKTLKDRNERLRLENEYKQMLMNDDDLQQRVNRLKLEREYKQLTAKEKSAGRKLVEDVLTTATKTVATAFVTKALTNLVNKALSKSEDAPAKETARAAKDTAKAATDIGKIFAEQAKESFRKTTTTTTTSSSRKTSFDSSDFDVSGEGTSRGSTKSKDNDFVYADFQDTSSNAGRSYFDTVFALPAPKDDKD